MNLTTALQARLKGNLEADRFETQYAGLAQVLGLPGGPDGILAAYSLWQGLLAIRPTSAYVVDEEGAAPVPVPERWLTDAIEDGAPLLVVIAGGPDVRLTEAGYRPWGWQTEAHVHIGGLPSYIPIQRADGEVIDADQELFTALATRGEVVKVLWPKDTVFALLVVSGVVTAWHIEADMACAAMRNDECFSYLRGWPLHKAAVRRLDSTGQREAIARALMLTQIRRCEWLSGCHMHSTTTTAPGSALALASTLGRETLRDLDQALGSHDEPFLTTPIINDSDEEDGDTHGVRVDHIEDKPPIPRFTADEWRQGIAALDELPLPKGLRAFGHALLVEGDIALASASLNLSLSTGQRRHQRLKQRLKDLNER